MDVGLRLVMNAAVVLQQHNLQNRNTGHLDLIMTLRAGCHVNVKYFSNG